MNLNWDGRVGPAFIVTLALALLTGLNWLSDSRAKSSERLSVVENQITTIASSVKRIEDRVFSAAR